MACSTIGGTSSDLPKNVNDVDGFLDFHWNIKQAFVAFLAQNLVNEGVDGYDAVAMLLQVSAYLVAVFFRLFG